MANVTRREVLAIAATSAFALATPALADAPAPFSVNEIVDDGHRFFGAVSHGLAEVVQEAASRWGLPNAYILGQEASGAFVAVYDMARAKCIRGMPATSEYLARAVGWLRCRR